MRKIFVGFNYDQSEFGHLTEEDKSAFNDYVPVEVTEEQLKELNDLEEASAKYCVLLRFMYKDNGGTIDNV